jgi:hypothetical protein
LFYSSFLFSYISPSFQQVNYSACCLLHTGFLHAYSSTLKMEVTCSSEMLVTFNGLDGIISQKIGLFGFRSLV